MKRATRVAHGVHKRVYGIWRRRMVGEILAPAKLVLSNKRRGNHGFGGPSKKEYWSVTGKWNVGAAADTRTMQVLTLWQTWESRIVMASAFDRVFSRPSPCETLVWKMFKKLKVQKTTTPTQPKRAPMNHGGNTHNATTHRSILPDPVSVANNGYQWK